MATLPEFLDASPTAVHAAESITASLDEIGYTRLKEEDPWSLEPGRGYYVVRDMRAVSAFIPGPGAPGETGLRIAASHLDSPGFKVKFEAVKEVSGSWRIPVEAYGSPIQRTWLDRELEVAGLVSISDERGMISTHAWRSGDALALIPSLAIHLDKEVNKGNELNIQQHLAGLAPFSESDGGNPIERRICRFFDCRPGDIVSTELFFVPAAKAEVLPADSGDGFIVSGRLDNLAMAHAILEGLPESQSRSADAESGIMAVWFDAEEVGSKSATGASSLFLDEIIERIVLAAGGGREELMRTRRRSFLISADMAHAVHPNYTDKHDTAYAPRLGGGPVLKSHSQKHYATDARSEAAMAAIAAGCGISLQKLIFRSDIPCGYSLGPLTSTATGIPAVDIGNPIWGMHSSRETSSLKDQGDMITLMRELWAR